MIKNSKVHIIAILMAVGLLGWVCGPAAAAVRIEGQVQAGGGPVAQSTVTLWVASANAPRRLAQSRTGTDGRFLVRAEQSPGRDTILYLVAAGGVPAVNKAGGNNPAITLLAVLGSQPPAKVTINELTTVASAFTAARFINGDSISGNPLGLKIAAGNVPNLVDPVTGGWGKVLVDPFNSTQTTTLANLDTLGSLITAFLTVANDDWRGRFLKAATLPGGKTPENSLEAIAGIARMPWAEPKILFALFDEAYPQPKDGSPRNAPFLPYLDYPPADFVLSLWFGGGGAYSMGNLVFDADGNLWSGTNWMAGSQSNVDKNIGGGVVKFAPNGTALSPAITGFSGMGTNGIGWGTGVTLDKVWAASFNGSILVMDFDGKPIGKETDFPLAGKVGQLMGVGVASNGDVWIADSSHDQLLYFPGGQVKDEKLVHVEGLKAPFAIAIDAQNRVWVTNSQADTVVRFPASDPSKVESFQVGISARGVALDSKGNAWVVSMLSPGFPTPKIPEHISVMEQFKLFGQVLLPFGADPKKSTGVVNMIRPDGTQLAPKGLNANGHLNVPWGVTIDGNDDVWVGGDFSRGVVLLAGADPKGYPAGTKPGDFIHFFQCGSIQVPIIGAIDPAGDVWVGDNWNNVDLAFGEDPNNPVTSTWGGGHGLTVIYGIAGPVKTPLMGQVQAN